MAGMIVDHKEHGIRYAVSERNYNPEIHEFVRDMLPGETTQGYRPRPKGSLGGQASAPATQGAAGDQATDLSDQGEDIPETNEPNQAEGTSTGVSEDAITEGN
jgi:hypothetical protein